MMNRNEGEALARNKRRLSLPDQSKQQASATTNLSKKRKVSNKLDTASYSKSIQQPKISKSKANSKHPTKHVCDKCMKAFEDSFDVVAHQCTSFKCATCNKLFDSDTHLKNHELFHNKAVEKSTDGQCKFCGSKFDPSSSLATHEAFCKNRTFKQCNMCNKKMHPRSKHEFCKKCISLIDKNSKDYSLRKNSKDSMLSENGGIHGGASLNTGTLNGVHQPKTVINKIAIKNVSSKSKKSTVSDKKLKDNLPLKSTATIIQETSTTLGDIPGSDDIFKSDTHINIRKTFDKSKKVFPDKTQISVGSHAKAVPDETPTLFKKPQCINSVKKNNSNKPCSNNNQKPPSTENNLNEQLKKNKRNVLLEDAVSKSKLLSFRKKQDLQMPMHALAAKGKTTDGSLAFGPQNKTKAKGSSNVGNTSGFEREIKIESLIDSLPDPNSGILLKCHGNQIDYKCVKCCKQFGSVELACSHYSSCKIKFIKLKKQFTSLSNVLWVCTLCNSHFDLVADLLKHKTSCSFSVSQHTFDSKAVNQQYSEKCLNKCKKCGFKCLSRITFEEHPCEESVKLMKSCSVKMDNSRKLEFKAKNVRYYHCKLCKKDFLIPKVYDGHMRKEHSNAYDGTLKPLFLQIRKDAHSVKQESNYADSSYESTPIITQTASLESLFSLPSYNSNFEDPENLTDQISSNDLAGYRISRVFESAPSDGEILKKVIGCKCDKKDSGHEIEDEKPCLTCLQNFSAKYILEKIQNDMIMPNSESSEELQAQLAFNYFPHQISHPAPSDHHPRSFPTPPATPDSIYSQGQSSQSSSETQSSKSDISAAKRLTKSDESQNNSSLDIETLSLKLSWHYNTDEIDAFATVASEDDLSVLKYDCARCYTALNENEVCAHMVMHHDKNSGDVNVSYFKQTV